METTLGRLARYVVSCARAFEADSAEILAAHGEQAHPGSYTHENYLYAAHGFLALYLCKHPANPYFGAGAALERHRELVDLWVRRWEKSLAAGCPEDYSEWPPFMTARSLELLGARLGPKRSRWGRFLAWWVEQELPKPFFFTAPNHEAWRLATTILAARVLRQPAWREQALFQTGQLLTYQTPDGFWEEGRHHGPSMKYNSLMLGALAVITRETGDRAVRAAAERLARFMARWSFPDGVTVGAFDGRQSASPGYFGVLVPGLELAPEGVTHLRRILDFWERAGWLDAPRAVGPSNWYAYFGMPFAAETLLHYGRPGASGQRAAPSLPLDAAKVTLQNHTPKFDGVLARRGRWAAGLSSQLSDMPKETQFIYRLERQSRIELWHQRASLVSGGGHSLVTARQPLYNAWVDPGFERDPDGYSRSADDAGSPEMARRRSLYYPRAASSGAARGVFWLELVFAHATVRFELEPAGDRVAIRYQYRAVGLRELRVALPLVLWRTARGSVDGRELPPPPRGTSPAEPGHEDEEVVPLKRGAASGEPFSAVAARREVAVETPLFGTRLTLSIPKAGATRVLWPLWPVRTYGKLFADERFESFFSIALVETVLPRPGRAGSGAWRLKVE